MRVDYLRRAKIGVDPAYRDHRARGWPGWPSRTDEHEVVAARLEELVAEYGGRGGRMLEIGCGSGELTLLAAPRGVFREIRALDLSEAAIEWAKEKAKERGLAIEFQVGNMVDLDAIADESFDVVVACACLHWIIGDDRRDCLANVARVLKSGGRVYVWTSYRREDPESDQADDHISERWGMPLFHTKTAAEILAEIGEAGLEVLHWEEGPPPYDADPGELGPLIVVAGKAD